MLLTIDVGNTNMVFGLLDGKKLLGSFRAVTNSDRTADELGLTVRQFFQHIGAELSQVEDTIISSVVPGVMDLLKTMNRKYFGKPPIVVDEDVDSGMKYFNNDTGKLGTDRSVAAAMRWASPPVAMTFTPGPFSSSTVFRIRYSAAPI